MGNNGNNSQRLNCPSCSNEILVNPVFTIRENTDDLHALIKGNLNKFSCTACKKDFLYDTPMVYRDDENHYVIYYHSSGINENVTEALGFMDEIYTEMFADLSESQKPVCRLTLRRKDLIEKIKLHQKGYDDRLVEYIKYQLFHHSKDLDSTHMDLLFDFGSSDDETLIFLAFDQTSGNIIYSLEFPVKEYSELRKNFLGSLKLENEFNKLFRGYYVQVDTLME